MSSSARELQTPSFNKIDEFKVVIDFDRRKVESMALRQVVFGDVSTIAVSWAVVATVVVADICQRLHRSFFS